ncbi:MAG TPA: hypothetical protein VF316_13885, partial [Polyangiaceae bacterium]
WTPANRTRLNKLITDKGNTNSTFDPKNRPVAVFDWDNTVLKNDIGDATFFWMLRHDKIRQPVSKDWGMSSATLTTAAKAAMNAACDGLAAAGDPLPTSTNTACADAIYYAYDMLTTPPSAGSVPAWAPEKTLTTDNPYAWAGQVQQGYTPQEIHDFARAAYFEGATAPIGTTQTVGSVSGLNGYVRIYDQIADLIGAMQENGFDVWVVSASPEWVVAAIAPEAGVPENHVVGIRYLLASNGKQTRDMQGCGTIADGANTIITFDEGKRCFINKTIFHELPASQMPTNPVLAKRPTFVAGDSDTDIAMLKDATELKLVINRNKIQTMCNALSNYKGKWIFNPMFIAPKAKKATAYTCSTTKDAAGNALVDEAGQTMTDQTEP